LTTADAPVTELTAAAYTIPTDAPESDGTLDWDSTTLVTVQARCADTSGVGYTYGSAAVIPVITGLLADVVVGHAVDDVGGAFDRMVKAVRNIGRPGIAGMAISAVDTALWDLKSRLLGLPLHRLLGKVRDAVGVYGSGGFISYDEQRLRSQLSHWVQEGIPRVKIKIGESWGNNLARDLSRIRQARAVIGPDAELFVDANGAYRAKQAIRLMADAKDSDVRWFEEPVSSDDLEGLRTVREAVRPDVAAGEYGYDLTYFQRMCAAGAVDCVQADVTRCGGYTEWLRIAAVAAAHDLEISGHCAPQLHAHVAAATPNFRHLEWFHDHVRIEAMAFDGHLDATGGALRPDPDTPGNGLTVRVADVERYRVR
jgi:L-alanine-DL-glutamate epimerase-like enolase superfamily enzyme